MSFRQDIGKSNDAILFHRSYSPLESSDILEKSIMNESASTHNKDLTFRAHLQLLLEQANVHLESQEVDYALQEFETYLQHCQPVYCKEEFQEIFENLARNLFDKGLKLMRKNQLDDAYLILAKMEKLSSPGHYGAFPEIRALAFNYLGCFFRRKEFMALALDNFEKALKIIEMTGIDTKRALTYINICAVMSQMGNRKSAKEHAKLAVRWGREELETIRKREILEVLRPQREFIETVNTYAIAYHDLGLEHEFEKNNIEALECYKKSVKIIEENLGTKSPLYAKFKNQLDTFSATLIAQAENVDIKKEERTFLMAEEKSFRKKRKDYEHGEEVKNRLSNFKPYLAAFKYSTNDFTMKSKRIVFKKEASEKINQMNKSQSTKFNGFLSGNKKANSSERAFNTLPPQANNNTSYTKKNRYAPEGKKVQKNNFFAATGSDFHGLSTSKVGERSEIEDMVEVLSWGSSSEEGEEEKENIGCKGFLNNLKDYCGSKGIEQNINDGQLEEIKREVKELEKQKEREGIELEMVKREREDIRLQTEKHKLELASKDKELAEIENQLRELEEKRKQILDKEKQDLENIKIEKEKELNEKMNKIVEEEKNLSELEKKRAVRIEEMKNMTNEHEKTREALKEEIQTGQSKLDLLKKEEFIVKRNIQLAKLLVWTVAFNTKNSNFDLEEVQHSSKTLVFSKLKELYFGDVLKKLRQDKLNREGQDKPNGEGQGNPKIQADPQKNVPDSALDDHNQTSVIDEVTDFNTRRSSNITKTDLDKFNKSEEQTTSDKEKGDQHNALNTDENGIIKIEECGKLIKPNEAMTFEEEKSDQEYITANNGKQTPIKEGESPFNKSDKGELSDKFDISKNNTDQSQQFDNHTPQDNTNQGSEIIDTVGHSEKPGESGEGTINPHIEQSEDEVDYEEMGREALKKIITNSVMIYESQYCKPILVSFLSVSFILAFDYFKRGFEIYYTKTDKIITNIYSEKQEKKLRIEVQEWEQDLILDIPMEYNTFIRKSNDKANLDLRNLQIFILLLIKVDPKKEDLSFQADDSEFDFRFLIPHAIDYKLLTEIIEEPEAKGFPRSTTTLHLIYLEVKQMLVIVGSKDDIAPLKLKIKGSSSLLNEKGDLNLDKASEFLQEAAFMDDSNKIIINESWANNFENVENSTYSEKDGVFQTGKEKLNYQFLNYDAFFKEYSYQKIGAQQPYILIDHESSPKSKREEKSDISNGEKAIDIDLPKEKPEEKTPQNGGSIEVKQDQERVFADENKDQPVQVFADENYNQPKLPVEYLPKLPEENKPILVDDYQLLDTKTIKTKSSGDREQVKPSVKLTLAYLKINREIEVTADSEDIPPLKMKIAGESVLNKKDGSLDNQKASEFLQGAVILSESNKIAIKDDWVSNFELKDLQGLTYSVDAEDGYFYIEGVCQNKKILTDECSSEEKEYTFFRGELPFFPRSIRDLATFLCNKPSEERNSFISNISEQAQDGTNLEELLREMLKPKELKCVLTELEKRGITDGNNIIKDSKKVLFVLLGLFEGKLGLEHYIEVGEYLKVFKFNFKKKFDEKTIRENIRKINPVIDIVIENSNGYKFPKKQMRLVEIIGHVEELIMINKNSDQLLEIVEKQLFLGNLKSTIGKLSGDKFKAKRITEHCFDLSEETKIYFLRHPVPVHVLSGQLKRIKLLNNKKELLETILYAMNPRVRTIKSVEGSKKEIKKKEFSLENKYLESPRMSEEAEKLIVSIIKGNALKPGSDMDGKLVYQILENCFDDKYKDLDFEEFIRQLTCNKITLKELYKLLRPRKSPKIYWKIFAYLDSKKSILSSWLKSPEASFNINFKKFKELLAILYPNMTSLLSKYYLFISLEPNKEKKASSSVLLDKLEENKALGALPEETLIDQKVKKIDSKEVIDGKINTKYLRNIWEEDFDENRLQLLALIANENEATRVVDQNKFIYAKDYSLFLADIMSPSYLETLNQKLGDINYKILEPDFLNQKVTYENLKSIRKKLIKASDKACRPLIFKYFIGDGVQTVEALFNLLQESKIINEGSVVDKSPSKVLLSSSLLRSSSKDNSIRKSLETEKLEKDKGELKSRLNNLRKKRENEKQDKIKAANKIYNNWKQFKIKNEKPSEKRVSRAEPTKITPQDKNFTNPNQPLNKAVSLEAGTSSLNREPKLNMEKNSSVRLSENIYLNKNSLEDQEKAAKKIQEVWRNGNK